MCEGAFQEGLIGLYWDGGYDADVPPARMVLGIIQDQIHVHAEAQLGVA